MLGWCLHMGHQDTRTWVGEALVQETDDAWVVHTQEGKTRVVVTHSRRHAAAAELPAAGSM